MNARTQVSPGGAILIPEDVLGRLAWTPGTPLELVESAGGITLRVAAPGGAFAPRSLAELRSFSPLAAAPEAIEDISRLSDEDINRLAG